MTLSPFPRSLLLLAVCGLLVGCAAADGSTGSGGYSRDTLRDGTNEFGTYTDPATGCEYLVWNGVSMGWITPRLGTDGKPICRKSEPAQ